MFFVVYRLHLSLFVSKLTITSTILFKFKKFHIREILPAIHRQKNLADLLNGLPMHIFIYFLI